MHIFLDQIALHKSYKLASKFICKPQQNPSAFLIFLLSSKLSQDEYFVLVLSQKLLSKPVEFLKLAKQRYLRKN